jgi:hypothetical protein
MESVDRITITELPSFGKLSLILNDSIFSPGAEIIGRVELQLDRRLLVRGLWVKFKGLNTVNICGDLKEIDLLASCEDYYLGGLHEVLFGFGEEREPQPSDLLELLEGPHSWTFSFTIPIDGPLSYCDSFAEVQYSVAAVLDTPSVPASVSQAAQYLVVGSLPCGGEARRRFLDPNNDSNASAKSNLKVLSALPIACVEHPLPRSRGTCWYSGVLPQISPLFGGARRHCRQQSNCNSPKASLTLSTVSGAAAVYDFSFTETRLAVRCRVNTGEGSKLLAQPIRLRCRLIAKVRINIARKGFICAADKC